MLVTKKVFTIHHTTTGSVNQCAAGTNQKALVFGKSYVSTAKGSLGFSVRGKIYGR
ncbi:hypothetical protein OK016_00540 [Vibrio chagasii]|nr:hypothetical protein [Vibrio chagasii]